MAQAILANLLASAQATTFEGRRLNNAWTHTPKVSVRDFTPCMTTRAHCTHNRRRFLSPRLLMPSSVGLPPVLY